MNFLFNLDSNQIKSGIRPCIAPKAGLARYPAKGKYGAGISGSLDSGVLVSCCPGPGSSWGNSAVPPPSTEGESPSHPFYNIDKYEEAELYK